jgi:flagellar FliL protein
MAIAKSSVVKSLAILCVFLGWTAGALWLGWQGPELTENYLKPKEEQASVAKYYPLEKFIMSIPGDKYPHYLLLEMTVKSHNPLLESVLLEADPVIRNSLMKMFSRKSFKELNNLDQLDSLQSEALVMIVKVLSENDFQSDIDEVLFTRMVIQ